MILKFSTKRQEASKLSQYFCRQFIVAAVMAAGAVTALRPGSSSMSVDETNTATAMVVASDPVAGIILKLNSHVDSPT
jgi:ClpP class serine protease